MIKAFTLIELLVSMIITCLVIFFAYIFLDSTGRFFNSLKADNRNISDALTFVTVITRELDENKDVEFNTENQEILLPGKDVKYFLSNNKIIRSAGILSDTFKTGFIDYELGNSELQDSVTYKLMVNFDKDQYELNFIKTDDVQQKLDENTFLIELRNGRD